MASLVAVLVLATCSRADRLVAFEIDGELPGSTSAFVEFGPVLLGEQPRRELTLRNPNATAVRLQGFSVTRGDVKAFSVALGAREVPAGGTTTVAVEFRPAVLGARKLEARLLAEGGAQSIDFVFRGGAVAACQAPEVFAPEFDRTSVGTTTRGAVRLHSPYAEPWPIAAVTVEVTEGADVFGLAAAPADRFTLPPAGRGVPATEVVVEFRPLRDGPALGRLRFPGAPGCPAFEVPLEAVATALDLGCHGAAGAQAPNGCRMDFGVAPIGTVSTDTLSISNRSDAELVVQVGPIEGSGTDRAPFAFGAVVRSLRVAARDTAAIPVQFQPVEPGQFTARFACSTDAGAGATEHVVLVGAARGPRLRVGAGPLELGEALPGETRARGLALTNTGFGEELLRFVQRDQAGSGWVPAPPFFAGPDAADFAIDLRLGTTPAGGIAAGATAELSLRFAPAQRGSVERTATLVLLTNDPVAPRVELPVHGRALARPACDLGCDPPELNFGLVPPDGSGRARLTLTNRAPPGAAGECRVEWAVPHERRGSATAFGREASPPGPYLLPPGEKADLLVGFHPDQEGLFAETLRFAVDGEVVAQVQVVGVSYRARLRATPQALDFGPVGVGCTSRLTARVAGESSIPALVRGVAVEGPAAAAFTCLSAPTGVVDPLRDLAVEVQFAPATLGDQVAVLTLTVEGHPSPMRIPLHGTAVPAQPVVELLRQAPRPQKDLLFVIDDSSAMADKQAALATALAGFFDQLEASDFDYHLAVTTTSVGGPRDPNGRFLPLAGPEPRIISRSTPDRRSAFLQNAQVGVGGSETPHLLMPVSLALSPPLLDGDNAGFLRFAARLDIVVISASADSDGTRLSQYSSFLRWLVPGSTLGVSMVAVVPTQPTPAAGCSYGSANAGTDARVASVVQVVGGIIDDICSSTWPSTVGDTAVWRFGRPASFTLRGTPSTTAAAPVEVRVDGVVVPPSAPDGTTNWLLESSNGLRFAPDAAPAWGSLVQVTYHAACQ